MGTYVSQVSATSNSSANTEDEFVELTAAASTSAFVKRVRISCNTPNSDVTITARICIMSGQGGGYGSGTSVKKRLGQAAPACFTTNRIKSGTTPFTLGGITSTVYQDNVNGRSIWEWIPRGNEEFIDSGIAGIVAVLIKVSAASVILNVQVEWEE